VELDYFLSFVEFKNILIKETYDLDAEDFVKYGKDMYLFFLYYMIIFKNFNSSSMNEYNNLNFVRSSEGDKNKSLSIVLKLNKFYRSGFYNNSSKNRMNKEIVNINMDLENIDLNTSYNISKPININSEQFSYSMRKSYILDNKRPLSYHERIAKFNARFYSTLLKRSYHESISRRFNVLNMKNFYSSSTEAKNKLLNVKNHSVTKGRYN